MRNGERKGERGRGRLLAPLHHRRLSHKSVLAAEAFYRRCLPHRRCRRRRRREGVNRQYTRWMRPSASPPTILGEGRERGSGWLGREGGKVDRLEERKQSADDDDAEGSSRRKRRGRIILAAASSASVWWMDGWMFGCENAIARFSSSSRRQAGRRFPNPGIQPNLKHFRTVSQSNVVLEILSD